jgi:DNA mismatch repair ATPase MutS
MRGLYAVFFLLLAQLRSVARVQDKATVESNAKGLYLALAAAHACLRFCGDELQLLMLPDSLPLHHELPARHVHLDAATVANLELESLVCMMDHTVTKGGGAFLHTLSSLLRTADCASPRTSFPHVSPPLQRACSRRRCCSQCVICRR